jgi:tyrosine-specific transport protein
LRHGFELLGKLNGVLTIVLIFSFATLVISALMCKQPPMIKFGDWMQLPLGLPILLCSFGYHQVIPIVCQRLNYDTGRINRALLIGTAIPLIFNATILALGFCLFTQNELAKAAKLGLPVFILLRDRFGSNLFIYAGQAFSLCAIGTSMIGISMAMKGALRDIFKSNKTLWHLVEAFIVIPLVPAIIKPNLFLAILGVAGGIFGNLIAGLLPVAPFLKAKRFRIRYALLWLIFAAIFVIECRSLI